MPPGTIDLVNLLQKLVDHRLSLHLFYKKATCLSEFQFSKKLFLVEKLVFCKSSVIVLGQISIGAS